MAISMLQRFLRAQTGATAVEYGLVAALVATAAIAAFAATGVSVQELFAGNSDSAVAAINDAING